MTPTEPTETEQTDDELEPNAGDEAEPNAAPAEPETHREHVDDDDEDEREIDSVE